MAPSWVHPPRSVLARIRAWLRLASARLAPRVTRPRLAPRSGAGLDGVLDLVELVLELVELGVDLGQDVGDDARVVDLLARRLRSLPRGLDERADVGLRVPRRGARLRRRRLRERRAREPRENQNDCRPPHASLPMIRLRRSELEDRAGRVKSERSASLLVVARRPLRRTMLDK